MFESYLEEIFLKQNPDVIKDNFEAAYDRWLSGLDVQDVIEYGNQVMDELYKQKQLGL